jgi:cytosine/adenosine deaminase-related metal-dependent hydrolase
VVAKGVITAVGPREQTTVPAGATVLSGAGRTVTAGFWNTHVHFTESKWRPADRSLDVRALARVRYTIRGGRIIYDSGK